MVWSLLGTLWKKARKENPPLVEPRELTVIALSGAAGAIVSVLITQGEYLTVDLVARGAFASAIVVVILYILVLALVYITTILDFMWEIWKNRNKVLKTLGSKKKE